MKNLATLMAVFWGGSAAADPGHLIAVGGHDHLIALGAIGAAIAAGVWGVVKGEIEDHEPEAETEEAQGA